MNSVLIDTDALLALYNPKDIHHKVSLKIHKRLSSVKLPIYITNLVFYETATLLSHRISHDEAKWFVKDISKLDLNHIFVDEELSRDSWNIFLSQSKNDTSFVDCANIAVLKQLKFDQIFSFDRIYRINGFTRIGLD